MDMDNIIRIIWDGKDWIFSGIGVAALGFIGNYIIGKVLGENSDKRSKVQDNNNASDGNIITGGKNQITKNENSHTTSVEGNGNVVGNGNSITNNYPGLFTA